MKEHNKITFTKEYCLCRRIPYKMKGEALYIKDKVTNMYKHIIYSVYNFPFNELVEVIDKVCDYDSTSTYFVGLK